ncbi:factor of DNA methylation 4-like [Vicia villosa]|uniref:factor of DNA methylation 4-like n=1 Tax=Vicia villosa TaxID=3911 RepID=UPI00273C39EF|nr:factor of DNA methylation 4-like [Vicia villosa]
MMNRKTEYTRESELDNYECRYFNNLKDGYYKLEVSDSTFRCPFCLNNDYYSLTDLSRHASRIAADVHGQTLKEIGKHSALVRYLKSLNVNAAKDKSPMVNVPEDKFVFPWTVVLANIVTKFDPNSRNGQTKFAIVEFGKEWDAFADALSLERIFESEHCGKRDYYRSRERGDKLFGWMARDDDYNSSNIVGQNLRVKADLKTVFEKKAEDDRKALKLAYSLATTSKQKNKELELEETTNKYDDEANVILNRVMNQKDEMHDHFNKEISNMSNAERNYLENMSKDREKTIMEVEARRNKLMAREKNLLKRKATDNDNERNNLYLEKKNIGMAIAEQQKADNEMMQTERETSQKMHDLVKGLDAKHALQLETERLRGAFKVMNHIKETDQEEKKKLEAIKVELREKEKQLEDLLQTLVIEEPKTNDELQDARKKLINCIGYPGDTSEVIISVKRMGELDLKPFMEASKRKFPAMRDGSLLV